MLKFDTLKTLRNEKAFNRFFDDVNQKADILDVDEPSMPRKRKVPKRFQLGDAEHVFPDSMADHYRHTYIEALDLGLISQV
ncbi:hypothetical protein DPMN_006787 [Dreissena polymorpha]|uniref:Uncharacterized protein n=1 Tax=Dreissena polymorpha TaxID=45954 RepID=A0A9D4RY32_DREPO|nr:hypothetical protein DPMN_006787 [Dreissena polymorpha]